MRSSRSVPVCVLKRDNSQLWMNIDDICCVWYVEDTINSNRAWIRPTGHVLGVGVLVVVHTRCQLISAMTANVCWWHLWELYVACKLDDILIMVYIWGKTFFTLLPSGVVFKSRGIVGNSVRLSVHFHVQSLRHCNAVSVAQVHNAPIHN